MIDTRKVAYHEASLILYNSYVEAKRRALGLYDVTFYTGKVNGNKFEIQVQVTAIGYRMARKLAHRKVRQNWIAQALERERA